MQTHKNVILCFIVIEGIKGIMSAAKNFSASKEKHALNKSYVTC